MLMMAKMHQMMVGGAVVAPFFPNAVNFDGSNDYMYRGAGLAGASDAATGIFHCWFRITSATNAIITNTNQTLRFGFGGGNNLSLYLSDGGSNSITFSGSTNYTGGTWHSLLWSWNTNFSAGNKISRLYVDDAIPAGTLSDTSSAFNTDYTQTEWYIGATNSSGANKFSGDVSQIYLAFGQFLDFSVVANRRAFITAANKPVNPGVDGSLPTGTSPTVYLSNNAANFQTNNGTGGGFPTVGALVDVTGPG